MSTLEIVSSISASIIQQQKHFRKQMQKRSKQVLGVFSGLKIYKIFSQILTHLSFTQGSCRNRSIFPSTLQMCSLNLSIHLEWHILSDLYILGQKLHPECSQLETVLIM